MQRLQRQFAVDVAQAQRVSDMASWLFAALHPTADQRTQRAALMLRCAAALHEVGMAVSHESYHRHGEYIVATPMRPASPIISSSASARWCSPNAAGCARSSTRWPRTRCCAIRRSRCAIAIVLCHARRDPDAGRLRLASMMGGWLLVIDTPWADAHPQSIYLLREEEKAWSRTPWPLELRID